MGSAASSRRYLDSEDDNLRHQIIETTVYKNGKEIFGLEKRYVDISEGKLFVCELGAVGEASILSIEIDDKLEIVMEKPKGNFNISVRDNGFTLLLTFESSERSSEWYRFVHEEIMIAKSKLIEGQNRGIDRLIEMFGSLESNSIANIEESVPTEAGSREKVLHVHDAISPPKMKIVILVVGTRGDVQPFVNLGLEFQSRGHVVRIATHSEYRNDVVKEGLLYYPLAGTRTTFIPHPHLPPSPLSLQAIPVSSRSTWSRALVDSFLIC
jgi:hypothetical protein